MLSKRSEPCTDRAPQSHDGDFSDQEKISSPWRRDSQGWNGMSSPITVRITSTGTIHYPDQRSTECHKCCSKGFTRRESDASRQHCVHTPLLLEHKDPDRVKITSLIKEDVLRRIVREARGPAASMLPTCPLTQQVQRHPTQRTVIRLTSKPSKASDFGRDRVRLKTQLPY